MGTWAESVHVNRSEVLEVTCAKTMKEMDGKVLRDLAYRAYGTCGVANVRTECGI